MASELFPVQYIAEPGILIKWEIPKARETINSFLKRVGWSTTRVPTTCWVNGEPLLRKGWNKRITKGMVVEFRTLPMGGGATTNSLLGLLGVIALTAVAPWAGGVAASALGFGALGAQLIAGAIVVGGGFFLSTLFRVQAGGSQDDAPPIYSLSRTTNTARPMQPIPLGYGRQRRTLDFAAVPWSSFEGNDQYYHYVLSEGFGKWSRERIEIGDTLMWDSINGVNPQFSGIKINFYDPNETIEDFPINVETSLEVDNQELQFATWTGGFIANASGTTATRLVCDYVMPSGSYATNDSGKIVANFYGVLAQYRPVDGSGNPTGDWAQLVFGSGDFLNKSQVRFSLGADVTPGRYEVRTRRTTPKSTEAGTADTIVWAGLRAFITGPTSFPVSTITLRAKATNQFSGDAASRISVIETRILPVWNGSEWVEQATRSPAWAAIDLITNETYGGGLSINYVDFQAYTDLAALNETRGDSFDYDFKSTDSVLNALNIILAVSRSKYRWIGNILSLVRDQWVAVPAMMLTDNEIVRGSVSIDYAFTLSTEEQCAVLEYYDETTWSVQEVYCPRDADEQTIANAARFQIPGLQNRDRAQLEVDFLYRQNIYRRKTITLDTEYDGRILAFGDVVQIQSKLPKKWGQSGKIARRRGLGLFLDRKASWSAAQYYISIRDKNGKEFGPIKCSRGLNDSIAVLDPTDLAAVETSYGKTLDQVLERAEGSISPSYAINVEDNWSVRGVLRSARPNGKNMTLTFFVDDPLVHDEDHTDPPPLPEDDFDYDPPTPIIYGLNGRFIANELPRRIEADWFPARGAIAYIAQVSYDDGASWVPLGEVRIPKLSAVVDPYALRLAVAGINEAGEQGAWAEIDVAEPTVSNDNVIIDVDNMTQNLQDFINNRIGQALSSSEFIQQLVAAKLAEQDIANYLDKQTLGQQLKVSTQRVTASYTKDISVVAGNVSALATQVETLTATVDNSESSLAVTWVVSASLPSGALASYDILVKVSDSVSATKAGISIAAYTNAGVVYSQVRIEAEQFVIVNSVNGVVVSPFTISGGNIYVAANMYLDGSITASKLNVATLQAISANLGTITAGRMLSPDGTVDFNLTSRYLDFYSVVP